jgi:tetratricopeptide (TPR) repeat protein
MRLSRIHLPKPAALAISAILTLLSFANSSPAVAEGFPGKGDRLKYADALPHYNLGNKYLAKEWYEKAAEKYIDAINIYPYDADVYLNLAVAYRKMGHLPEAEEATRKAVEMNDTDWTGWANLGNMLMAQEKFPEAYKCFVRAMKCDGIPAEDKSHMESNIDGMKKILKARGLTIDGKEISPPAVAGDRKGKPVAGKTGATASKTGRRASASEPISRGSKKVGPPVGRTSVGASQTAGGKDSDLDSGAYDQWLGN